MYAQRQHVNFDDNWKFSFGHAANPEKDFSYSLNTAFSKSGGKTGTAIDQGFADSSWRKLNLPHDWAVELPFANVDDRAVESHGYKPVGGLFPATSIGWYRKHFMLTPTDSGKRFQLQFDGVFRDAQFWINGFYLGNNKSGYVGANYDITDFINFDKENVVVVRVDATQYEGWFYEGAGIYRHVWLNQFSPAHVENDGVFAYATITGNKSVLSVETTVRNDYGKINEPLQLITSLLDRNGKVIAVSKGQTISFKDDQQQKIKQVINVNNPTLWSLDNPYLYHIVTELRNSSGIVDVNKIRFGFRTIEIKTDGVYLNGQYLKIKGTNNHQDHAGVGSAMPDYLQYYRIELLKRMGCNAYRTSHNAPTPELLEACDSLGMLVLDEQRLLNSGAEYMDQFKRVILRDRNHPSVFMWSIGNEEGYIQTNANGRRIAQTMIAYQQQLDPTRTCTYAADLANTFKGVNEVIPVRGFNYRQYAAEAYHKDHPDQPLMGTEMGSTVTTRGQYETDSIMGYLPDHDLTAPWWASKAQTWWTLAATNRYWLGGFIWTGFDYRGEPTPFTWPNISSHFGVMDVCGFPKNLYYYYQSWWTDKDVLNLSPHWNWPVKWGEPAKQVDVWVNSNADNVELFLNGKSLGKKDMPRNEHLQWTVAYKPGKLEAVAYKKGRRLTTKVETTGPAAEIVVSPTKTVMLANGKDAVVLNISIIDKEGREIPDANNKLRFHISGPGKIIGVGNGDPSCHEPDKCMDGLWQRSAFNGKCQVIIQSDGNVGNIQFEAVAPGLETGGTGITTIAEASVNTVSQDKTYEIKGAAAKQLHATKMIGADISFLPELENRGMKFSDNNVTKDALEILKDHGFNYVRLRIFNDPAQDSGYSPNKGFCDLQHTKAMAKRVKDAGMKFLLDFHYSDYWADPGHQNKPAAWKGLSFPELKKALYDYTFMVMTELKQQGTLPDMVQVGNEINHGMVWPEGDIKSIDSLAQLIQAGTAAVKAVAPATIIMLHVALGGQNDETVFFFDNMLKRNLSFDVIGLSYYPKWHGTPEDLRDNMYDLIRRYDKDIIVVEYSAKKETVNQLVFDLPNGRGKGACIWEPLSTWEAIFDWQGKSNDYIKLYDEISREYLK